MWHGRHKLGSLSVVRRYSAENAEVRASRHWPLFFRPFDNTCGSAKRPAGIMPVRSIGTFPHGETPVSRFSDPMSHFGCAALQTSATRSSWPSRPAKTFLPFLPAFATRSHKSKGASSHWPPLLLKLLDVCRLLRCFRCGGGADAARLAV